MTFLFDDLIICYVCSEKALLKWVAPEGHARLKAFNILCVSKVKHCMLYIERLNTREMHIKYNNKLVLQLRSTVIHRILNYFIINQKMPKSRTRTTENTFRAKNIMLAIYIGRILSF